MKKRITSLLLTVAMIMSMIVVPTAAADSPTITIGSASGMPGDEISIDLNISGLGSTELSCLGYVLKYDPSVLTYVSANHDKSNWDHYLFEASNNAKKGTITFGDLCNDTPYTGDNTFATVIFKINEDVTATDPVTLTLDLPTLEVVDFDDQLVETTVVDGFVTVDLPDIPTPPAYTPAESVTITAEQLSDTRIKLSGEFAPATADVDKVYIYYGEDLDNLAPATEITWTPGNNTFYTTVDVNEGATIYYKAVAANKDDTTTESITTKIIMAVTPRPTTIAISGPERINATDAATGTYTYEVKDQNGNPFTAAATWAVNGPEGVSIDPNNGVLSIDYTKVLRDYDNITVRATVDGTDISAEINLVIVRWCPVDSITVSLATTTEVKVPTAEQGSATVQMAATLYDKYGMECIGEIASPVWSIDGNENVTIDPNSGLVTILPAASAGTYTVTAKDTATGKVGTYDLIVAKDAPVPKVIEITGPVEGTVLPGKNNTLPGFAVVKVLDQYGAAYTGSESVVWSNDQGFAFADGTLTIPANFDGTSVTVTATCGSVSDDIVVSLSSSNLVYDYSISKKDGVHGDMVKELITIESASVSLNGTPVPGSFTLLDPEFIPNAGPYTFTVRFESDEKQPDGKPLYSRDIQDTITIAKAPVVIKWNGTETRTYDGDASKVTAYYENHAGEKLYVAVSNGDQTNAGTYTATVAPFENDNYVLTTEASTQYIIEKKEIAEIKWNGTETRTYNGLPSNVSAYYVDIAGQNIPVTGISGHDQINADTHTATVNSFEHANYKLNAPATVEYIIEKANVQLSGLTDQSIYAGMTSADLKAQIMALNITASGVNDETVPGSITVVVPDSLDDFALNQLFDVTVKFASNNSNYNDCEAVIKAKVINKDSVEIKWEGTETREYDGNASNVTAYYTDLAGAKVYVDVIGGDQTNAGTYTAKVAPFENDNYKLATEVSTQYIIEKKEITEIKWNGTETRTYDGQSSNISAYYVDIAGASVPVTVSNGAQTNAGTYTATVASFENDNYKLISDVSTQYIIEKKEITEIKWEGTETREYNGNASNVTAYYTDLAGAKVDVEVIDGTKTNAGTYTAKVAPFEHDNYKLTDEQTAQYIITKKAVSEITWAGAENLVYNGQPASVTASFAGVDGQNVAVSVINGDQTDAGTYTATVKAADFVSDNYELTNDFTKEYTIAKKSLAIEFHNSFNLEKFYDGKQKNFYKELAKLQDVELKGIEAGDDVVVDIENSVFEFPGKDANDEYTVKIALVLTGDDADNYTVAEATYAGKIKKIEHTDEESINALKQMITIPEKITVGATPEVESSIKDDADNTSEFVLEYGTDVAAQPGTDCTHDADSQHTDCEDPGACKHEDGCTGHKEPVPAHISWSKSVPTTPGTYHVRVVMVNPNVAPTPDVEAEYVGKTVIVLNQTLTVEAAPAPSVGGGGGGAMLTNPVSVSKTENGSVSLSNKYASAGKEVTITVKPDEGYELKSITITDAKGNKVEVTEKNGKFTFKMPATKVTINPEFVKIAQVAPAAKYNDLDADAWYYEAVNFAVENGIMTGISDTKFAPGVVLTRNMVAQILWAMEGKPVVNYALTFKDVPSGSWYTEAVRWAASEGIVSGYSADAFGSSDCVTREQMAVMLCAYARYKGADMSVGENTNILSYNDAFSISEWAIPSIQWACGEGILSGKTGGYLDPAGTATRMEAAQMLMKFSAVLAD